jgi:glycosyltransferase involved in cell wall biosynthesis
MIEMSSSERYPLVSVVIPLRNRFEYADRAVVSVLTQTYKNWELIIIDDCSDSTYIPPEVSKKVGNDIKLLRNEFNVGPGISRQRGIYNSTGSYICFLDSDDYYHPEFIEKSLEKHFKFPDIGVTFTAAVYIQSGKYRECGDEDYRYIMPTLFEKKRPWPTCSLLWKREMIAEWSDLRTNQDSLFELECSFINNRIEYVSEVLCYIDKGTGQNTHNLVRNRESDLHRNYVALYAYRNRKKIAIPDSDQKKLNDAIVYRIMLVSSKLASHGLGLQIFKNGLSLFLTNKLHSIILVILSAPVVLPSFRIRNICKSLIYSSINI